MSTFVALAISGVALGAVLALVVSGFVVLHKASGVVNFAHGDLVMLGAYLAYWAINDLHMPILLGYGFALVLMFVVGVLLERFAYAPLRRRPQLVVVIATLAAALIIRSLVSLWFGSDPHPLPTPVGDRTWTVLGAHIAIQRVLIIVVVAVTIFALVALFQRTSFGRQVRTIAADREAAELYGVRVRAVSLISWGLSSMLACLAGILIGPLVSLDLTFGFNLMLTAFAAAVIGGFGNLTGALLCAVGIGLLQQLVGGYWFRDYAAILPFVAMFALVAVRPEGFVASRSRL